MDDWMMIYVCLCCPPCGRVCVWIYNLMGLIVSVLVLITRHIAGAVDEVFAAGDPLSLARLIEALLVRTGVLGRVGESTDRGRRFPSLEIAIINSIFTAPFGWPDSH